MHSKPNILPPELSRFLDEVPHGEPDGLQSIKYKVLRHVINHRGAANAISIDIISEGTGYTARSIKAAVKALVETYAVPIGSSRHEPYGYFIIESPEDLAVAMRPLRAEIASLAHRVKMLAGNTMVKQIFGEVQMELGFAEKQGIGDREQGTETTTS